MLKQYKKTDNFISQHLPLKHRKYNFINNSVVRLLDLNVVNILTKYQGKVWNDAALYRKNSNYNFDWLET